MPEPGKTIQVQATREELGIKYAECVANNPLLARIEGQCRSLGWTDAEIRTMQLLTAVASNADMLRRLREYELNITSKK